MRICKKAWRGSERIQWEAISPRDTGNLSAKIKQIFVRVFNKASMKGIKIRVVPNKKVMVTLDSDS